MVIFGFILVIFLIIIGMLGTGSVYGDVVDLQAKVEKLRIQIEALRLMVDAKDLIIDGQSLEIAELKSKNEDMKVQLMDLSNKYTVAKKNIEALASDAVRSGGVKWAKEYETRDE